MLAGTALAQEYRATITGRVVDPQGASLPGATVTALNIKTNVGTDTVSNEQGAFSLPQLPAGEYQLIVEIPGFRRFVREGLVLQTAERATITVTMALGGVEETLIVTAALSSAETNRSTISQTVDNKQVSELPLNGRQVYMLLQQTPGTLFTQTSFGSTGFSGTRAWDTNGSVSIHGSRTGNNEFLIDGAPNAATGGWQYAPVVDAIEEFKVNSSSVDASYGRTSGGVINMTMKSGTNQLRGSAFAFFRGNALDANSTQNNAAGVPKRDHIFTDGGAVLSGPILQNRTFFMTFYEGFYEDIPFPRTSTVPTELERQGDFSQTLNSAGQPITIYDPLSTRPDPNRPGRFIRDAFPNNRIPQDRLDPVAQQLMQFIPPSNAGGESFTQANNLVVSPNLGKYRYNSYFARIDHKFSDGHKLTVNNTANWGSEFRNSNGFPLPSLRGNWPKHRNHYMTSLDDVVTLNNTTVLNFRASYDRFNDYNPIDYAALQSPLGIQTPFQVVPAQYPYVVIDGYQDFFPGTYSQSVNNIYSTLASLSKTAGNHFIKAGAEFRSYRLNRVGLGDGNGKFQFQRAFTQRDPQAGDATSGNAMATFLLGYPSGETWVDVNATSARQYLYAAIYVQDDWKIGSKLTLNLGLRYDVQPPPTERYDRQTVGFDPDAANPFAVPGLSLRGGLLFAGVDGNPRAPYETDWSAIQPRAGLAYALSERLTLRSTYGRSYLPLTGGAGSPGTQGQEGIQQTGFSRRTTLIGSVQTGSPFNTLGRPYPDGIIEPENGSAGLATNIGAGFDYYNRDFKVPYTDQWMAGFSLDLPWSTTLDASYVANRVRRLPPNGREANRWPQSEQDRAIERLGGNANYLNELVPNPFAGLVPGTALNNPTIARSQLLRPFPQFTGINEQRRNDGSSTYDAFELAVNRRFSHGVQLSLNYARMRQYEALRWLNVYDPEPFEEINELDRSYRLTINGLVDLPFGPGRAIGGQTSGLVGALIGGWQFNMIGEFQSGSPVEMPNGILRQDSARIPDGEQSLDRWFDNSTRTNPRPDGSYAWDVLPPNDYRVVGFRMRDVRTHWAPQWAMSLFKNTRIGRYTTQFRAEAFNAFNTPIYGTPEVGITNARFGRITANQINFPRHIQLGVRVLF